MKISNISNTKNNLSALLEQVKSGRSILIVDRNRPIARLDPVDPGLQDDGARLSELERRGAVTPSAGRLDWAAFKAMPMGRVRGGSLTKAVLDERAQGR